MDMMGFIPATVVHRNVIEPCASEWGVRELRWCLAPITGISAPEHEFACVCSADDTRNVHTIAVFKRGDKGHILFQISTSPDFLGAVTRVSARARVSETDVSRFIKSQTGISPIAAGPSEPLGVSLSTDLTNPSTRPIHRVGESSCA